MPTRPAAAARPGREMEGAGSEDDDEDEFEFEFDSEHLNTA
jgi:hypothetical protein